MRAMAHQIYIVLTVEGTTDTRFLEALLEPVFQEMALRYVEADVDCSVFVQGRYDKSEGFAKGVVKACKDAMEQFGATTLAVHTDADRMTYDKRKETNFTDVFETVKTLDPDGYCTIITPVIPVRMMEAWMLADRDLLRREIGTTMTNGQLGIDGDPESFADPKEKIEEAIRRASQNASHKKPVNAVEIGDLYSIIGKSVTIDKLEQLESFRRFEDEILTAFKEIGLRI